MISKIKNVYLRRTVLVVTILPITVISALVGAVDGAWSYLKDIPPAVRYCWEK